MQPLKDIKILDLTRLLPGPFASMVLADMGARVDKVEEGSGGDYLRHMPPQIGDQSAIFLAINRNKRSIQLDLKSDGGRDALLRLVRGYDVLFDQFRPGVLDRLGLGYDKLQSENPRLIICALTGYGQDGPLSQRAGHDLNYVARAGLLGSQGPAGAPPSLPGFQAADIGGGLWAVIGILGALQERARSGQGSVVDVSMLEASMGLGAATLGTVAGGVVPARGAEPLTGSIAAYATYETKDEKYVALGALEPKFWTAFCGLAGIDVDMMGVVPGPHQEALKKKIADVFLTRTRDEWVEAAKAIDCCLEPVLGPEELAHDAHLVHRKVFFELDSAWGKLLQFRTPVTPVDKPHEPPPKAGEHTRDILREAGFSIEEIERLAK